LTAYHEGNVQQSFEKDIAVTGRRHFLAQLAGLAASMSLESKANRCSPGTIAARGALAQHDLSRLVAGSNPIRGYS
jgi:hypothetical protein